MTVFADTFALIAWSLTDCISFAVMAERRLSEALTADQQFEQAGFWAVFG